MSARSRLPVVVGIVVVLVAAAVVVVAVNQGSGDKGVASGDTIVAWPPERRPADSTETATAARHTGPQGRVGQFVVTCERTHAAPDDPIVHPGHPGRSHQHEFYGAEGVDADTTPASMLEADTTCNKPADRAAYWHPTLYDHGQPVEATELAAYYRAAPGVDPADLEPFPLGLALIAGDMTATTPQPGESVGWTCGTRSALSDAPSTCPVSAPLHLVLTFQDCWDGTHLDSDDHRSHVAYSTNGDCPASHPAHIPQITATVGFPISGADHDLSLASGNVYSLHGDFFNGWEPDGLRREIDSCLRRHVVCDLQSNRDEPTILDNTAPNAG